MKSPTLLLLFFALLTSSLNAQQVNYYEVGKTLTDQLNQQAADREARRQYYSRLRNDIKNSLSSTFVYSECYLVNELISETLTAAESAIDIRYSLLTSGNLQPNAFENRIQQINSEAAAVYRNLKNVADFKNTRKDYFGSDIEALKAFEQRYEKTIKAISGINFNMYNRFEFDLIGMKYSGGNDKNSIYPFITNSSNGSYETYIQAWEQAMEAQKMAAHRNAEARRIAAQQEAQKKKELDDSWREAHETFIDLREEHLANMTPKVQKIYLKNEFKTMLKMSTKYQKKE